MMIHFRYILFLFCFFYSCNNEPVKSDTSFTTSSSDNTVEVKQDPSNKSNDQELQEEVVAAAIEAGKNILKTLKRNDSISATNREEIYAYQIGLPVIDLDEVFEIFNQLDNTESFYVLKKDRKEYYIIYMDDSSQQTLKDSLQSFKVKLPDGLTTGVKVTNLMALCPKRKKLMLGEKITKRKQNLELPCLICDK